MAWFGKRRRQGSRPADGPAPEDTLRAGHDVLGLVGVTLPYADFLTRVQSDAADRADAGPTTSDLWRTVQRLLVEHGRAFERDWKWGTPADLLAEVARLVPGSDPVVERQERVDGRWRFRAVVLEVPVEGDGDAALPHHVVDAVNPVLVDRAGLELIYYSSGADAHCFLLAPADRAAELRTPRYAPVLG